MSAATVPAIPAAGRPGLERAIEASRHAAEGIALTYLGQVGFLFQHRGLSVVVDPYLSYSGDESPDAPPGMWQRNYPPPIPPDRLRGIDLVLCTHDHLDHTDPQTLLAIRRASPRAVIAGPHQSIETLVKAGFSRQGLRTLDAGTSFTLGDLTVEPVAAAHEDYVQDAEGRHAYLGYVLRWAGLTLFHAGDTTPQEKLSADLDALKGHGIDIGFLPINGRNAERNRLGIVGNMDAAEAVAFAVRHRFGLVVPTHYDLYPNNGASLSEFVRLLEEAGPQQPFKAFRVGEQLLLSLSGAASHL